MDAIKKQIQVPNYIKYFFILANILLSAFVLTEGDLIIRPLLAALIVAILLNPLYNQLHRLGIPRIISATISVLIFLLAIILLLSFITTEIGYVTADPALSIQPVTTIINSFQSYVAKIFNFSLENQMQFAQDSLNNFLKQFLANVPNVFKLTTSYISMLLLFFMSTFFFLYYSAFLMNFIFKLFKGNEARIKSTTIKIEDAVKNYIVGLFMVILIIAFINSISLLIIGVHHAVFFAILAALLTLIPYIGILIGSLLPVIFSFLTTNSLWYPIAVLLVFWFVQFLEGNFITPNIIGQKENINPYIAILGLYVGGMLLGPLGIILAIPLLGIMKIICDDIEYLKPIGYVMGNPPKESNALMRWVSKLKKRIMR